VKFLIALLLLFAGSVRAVPAEVLAYRSLVEQDLRLATIGYRLAAANAPFCKRTVRNPGMVLHDIAQYPDRKTATAAFAFPEPTALAATVEGGPSAKAGLQPGDGVRAIGATALDYTGAAGRRATYERLGKVKAILSNALEGNMSVEIAFVRGSTPGKVTLAPPLVCAGDFWVDTQNKLDAGADGVRVRVTTGLMLFASNDDELAAAVAHELAHIVLGHRDRLVAVKRGKTKAIYETEVEADRLSVWLMANAGYDTAAALRFAERYGRQTGLGIFSAGTHPRWQKRVETMQAEIALIAQTPRQSGRLPPPLLIGG
jgi:beta-barrel assembly-enhancing protease